MANYLQVTKVESDIKKGNSNLLIFPIIILAIFIVALQKK